MGDKIKQAIFSFNGVTICVACAGFLSAIVTMFVDITGLISVKWLVGTLWLSVTILVALLKQIHDLSAVTQPEPAFERPISYEHDLDAFIIRRNEHFLLNSIAGCYFSRNGVERLAFIGMVNHLQEQLMHIRIIWEDRDYDFPTSAESLNELKIRPAVPMAELQEYFSGEQRNNQ
ncbi:hypothetical protein FEE59_22115 [Herbaspirillum sp. RU 5E]|nr:hypothetical protein [Herbaspirillum sp. RU 5E]